MVDSGPNGAAEHVDEKQHEDDRHDRHRDDRVGAALDVAHGAPEKCDGVAHGFHRPASFTVSPTTARKISSSVGCFSTYSTFVGGRSRFSSSSVPSAMIAPRWRIAILS